MVPTVMTTAGVVDGRVVVAVVGGKEGATVASQKRPRSAPSAQAQTEYATQEWRRGGKEKQRPLLGHVTL